MEDFVLSGMPYVVYKYMPVSMCMCRTFKTRECMEDFTDLKKATADSEPKGKNTGYTM